MFAWGMEHGLCKTNPFGGTALATAPVRERFLTKDEAIALLSAISRLESAGNIADAFADALRLLLLTGARKTEILGLRWSEVDFDRKVLTLPPQRTKAGGKTGTRRIQLSPPALDILDKRRTAFGADVGRSTQKHSAASNFVFPATRGQGHAVGVRKVFERVCKEAMLEDLRIHDLRHSFASFAIADGASLFLVGKLLGHASSRTTERYAHLSGDPRQEAVNSIGRTIVGADK
jgi:integrase